jgi:hypothetical protein
MKDDFEKLLRASSLGPTMDKHEPIFICAPNPFIDPDRGRVWHARHLTANLRGRYAAASLCGVNLIQSAETIEGSFPPASANYKPCAKCLFLADPTYLSQRAFKMLGEVIAGTHTNDKPIWAWNELFARDYIARDGQFQVHPTKFGWRAWRHLRRHPAFSAELTRAFPDE